MRELVRTVAAMLFVVCTQATQAESTAKGEPKEFGGWKVKILVDDFEGKVQPTPTADVLSPGGQKIGIMTIDYFMAKSGSFDSAGRFVRVKGVFDSALVSFYIDGLDAHFPACHYQSLQFKIDTAESQYFPTRNYACRLLEFKQEMAARFSEGKTMRFSARGKTGLVSLAGFKDAWMYTLSEFKK